MFGLTFVGSSALSLIDPFVQPYACIMVYCQLAQTYGLSGKFVVKIWWLLYKQITSLPHLDEGSDILSG